MTRFAVTWSAFSGHRICDTRAEALALAARIRVNRGEEPVITELREEAVAQAPAACGLPATPVNPEVARRDPPAPMLSERAPAPSVTTVGKDSVPPRDVEPQDLIDEVLGVLGEDEDLRVRTHTARIVQYRRERAAGAAIPRRYRAGLQRPF